MKQIIIAVLAIVAILEFGALCITVPDAKVNAIQLRELSAENDYIRAGRAKIRETFDYRGRAVCWFDDGDYYNEKAFARMIHRAQMKAEKGAGK